MIERGEKDSYLASRLANIWSSLHSLRLTLKARKLTRKVGRNCLHKITKYKTIEGD